MKITFRSLGAIIFAVGCILEGYSLYLLFYNWYFEEANNVSVFVYLSLISNFIWLTGFTWLFGKDFREGKYPKKVLGLFALGFVLVLVGLSILIILPESFWLFLLFVILGILTFSMSVYYEQSHPEKFKRI
jgi:hypothetical protein